MLLAMPTKKKTLRMHFSANLRAARKRSGMSQEALANLADLHRTYIGQVENAGRNISIDSIEKLVKALDIDPAELMSGWHVVPKNKAH
jgi:transcriptional regulator with XRE-family HTH domain